MVYPSSEAARLARHTKEVERARRAGAQATLREQGISVPLTLAVTVDSLRKQGATPRITSYGGIVLPSAEK